MKIRCMEAALPLIALLMFSSVASAQAPQGRGKGKAAEEKPSAPADPHDLSGIWVARGTGIVMTDVPPMTPEGKAKFDSNKPSYGPRAIPPALGNDPMGNCDPLGIPRLLFFENNPGDFEMVQAADRVVQLHDRHHVYRVIWTDGRPLPKNPEPSFMGYSVGKFEGDTFVVNTVGFDDRTWLDHFGQPHTDEMRLEERYHRVDHDHMEFVMTITDPKFYTKPWVSGKKIFRISPLKEFVSELFCVPSEEQAFNRNMRDPAGGVIKK